MTRRVHGSRFTVQRFGEHTRPAEQLSANSEKLPLALPFTPSVGIFVLAWFAAAAVAFAVPPTPTNPKTPASSDNPALAVEPRTSNLEPAAQAALFFRSGLYEKALPLFQQELAAAGTDAEAGGKALFHIGQCLTALKRYTQAIAAFDSALAQFPKSSWADDALLRKGAVQAGFLRKTPSGIATWKQLVEKYPRSEVAPEARFYMGMLQWIEGQKSQAKETWRILIRDFPRHDRSAQAQLYLQGKSS